MTVDEEKAIGQFKLQLNGVMAPFRSYGQEVYIVPAVEEIAKLALKLHRRLSGEDVKIG